MPAKNLLYVQALNLGEKMTKITLEKVIINKLSNCHHFQLN